MIMSSLLANSPSLGSENIVEFSISGLWKSFIESLWSLVIPFIILGGILGGFFTPTESAAVAAVYALVVSVILKDIGFKDILSIIKETVIDTSLIAILIAAAGPFAWVITMEQIPQVLMDFMLALSEDPNAILLLIIL